METRTNDLETVSQLRSARVAAVSRSRGGDVESVLFSDQSSLEAQVYVVKLLDVYPALGKVAGRRLMAELGLAPLARVADLSTQQLSMLRTSIGGLHE